MACELGQAFHYLGTREVTLLDRADRLLERFEPFVSEKVAAKFRDLGISVHTSANVTRVQRPAPNMPVQVSFDGG